ncbi:MAG TPA: 16S rRNA (guanine(966)-N(2))-methyltransferase RsmD [Caulobacteraceae bacterium]|jgi:16S rRNA (guanine966-N2)-methyltransferase
MRIIAGALRGRRLVAPGVHSTRPTADRTRQAIFNVLEHTAWARPIEGARVADLFAGSGALGIEALSRGAAYCLFVENDRAAGDVIARNLDEVGCAGRSRLVRGDARRGLPHDAGPFDLVFLDPPYGKGLDLAALAAAPPGWLAPDALVVIERGVAEAEPQTPGLERIDDRTWGAARVWFLKPIN